MYRKVNEQDVNKHTKTIFSLLPPSRVWEKVFRGGKILFTKLAETDPDISDKESIPDQVAKHYSESTILGRFFAIFGIAFAKLSVTIEGLLKESVPYTAVELLSDWERNYNISWSIDESTVTIAHRQERLQYLFDNDQEPRSFKFLTGYAEILGGVITLENKYYHGIINELGSYGVAPDFKDVPGGELGGFQLGTSFSKSNSQPVGGYVLITIVTLDETLTHMSLFKKIVEKEILTSCRVLWVGDVPH